MRSLSNDTLSTLIADSIYKFEALEFLDVTNVKRDKINVLVSPSINDKIILLNAISIILHRILEEDNKSISAILKSISEVYNGSNIKYIEEPDINFYKTFITHGKYLGLQKITFLNEDSVATINDLFLHGLLANYPSDQMLFNLQLFIYASVWFGMDEYLKLLYHLYL